MTLSRQVLRKIDDTLRSEFDQEKGEWMAKVPISGATKAVWQRYCQAVGVVVVVFTERGDRLRLISARLATRRERRTYER